MDTTNTDSTRHADGAKPGLARADGSASSSEYRAAISEFGEAMLAKLQQNRHKGRRGAWQDERPDWLASRIHDELAELETAVDSGDAAAAMREAADVANFAMMVWDFYACRQNHTIGHTEK